MDKFIAVTFLKFQTLILFFFTKIKCLSGLRAVICKMLFRLANREDPDQTDLGLGCLSRPFGLTTSVWNFWTSTEPYLRHTGKTGLIILLSTYPKNTIYRCSKISNTSFLPKWPRQTAQTQKQCDQGLPCLLLWQAFCEIQPWGQIKKMCVG